MKRSPIRRALLVWCALASAPLISEAQTAAVADRGPLERLALARARRDALEQTLRLPLEANTFVGEWVTKSPARERAARLWARTTPRTGGARFYSDGVCEADVRLTAEEIAAGLTPLCELGEPEIKPTQIQAAARKWPTIWGSGQASVSERVAEAAAPGWEDVAAEGVQLARLAATADAAYALVDAAGKLRVTPARRLREFLDSSDALRDAVAASVREAARMQIELGPDQLAQAEARLNIVDLVRILSEAHQKHYAGELFHAADFREMALLNDLRELRATGLAPPPERYIQRPEFEPIELDAPEWAALSRAAGGVYSTTEHETLTPAQHAEAARVMAIDELRKQIENLPLGRGVSVTRFLEFHPELKDDVIVFLSGGRLTGDPRPAPGGGVEARVELPLRRLWLILRRGIPIIEAEPTSAPAPESQPASSPTEESR